MPTWWATFPAWTSTGGWCTASPSASSPMCSCATPCTGSRCASSAATCARPGSPACRWACLILVSCFLGGAAAGLAGMVEVAAVHGSANASLIAGYGYAGILVSFIARHNPLAILPVAIAARRHRGQRRDAAAAAGSAGRDGAGAAGHRFHGDPGERDPVRALSNVPAARVADAMDGDIARLVGRADRGAGRRDPRQHPVPVREPRRMPHREERAHQSGTGRHPGDGRHEPATASLT